MNAVPTTFAESIPVRFSSSFAVVDSAPPPRANSCCLGDAFGADCAFSVYSSTAFVPSTLATQACHDDLFDALTDRLATPPPSFCVSVLNNLAIEQGIGAQLQFVPSALTFAISQNAALDLLSNDDYHAPRLCDGPRPHCYFRKSRILCSHADPAHSPIHWSLLTPELFKTSPGFERMGVFLWRAALLRHYATPNERLQHRIDEAKRALNLRSPYVAVHVRHGDGDAVK